MELFNKKQKGIVQEVTAKTKFSLQKRNRVFLFFFLLFPVVQFVVFYIGVNVNSLLLAFKEYDVSKGEFVFVGFTTFSRVLEDIFVNGALVPAIEKSFIQFLLNLFSIPIHVMVAYVVFKKVPFSGFFKIMLFMPNMISSMVFVVCGEQLITNGFPIIFGDTAKGLLNVFSESSFWTVLIFGFWMQFANGLIIYLGAMSTISNDVMEYNKLEKLSTVKELWHVVVPLIFPTITTYIIVTLAGFFTNYGFFYAFFDGAMGAFDTLGYIFFVKVAHESYGVTEYAYASAGGILFTIVLTAITFAVKTALEKYGPSED